MKRFLAVLAVMTLIVSMFSGVVLAGPTWTFDLDNNVVTYVSGFYYGTVTGRAINDDGVPVNVDKMLYLWKDNNDDGILSNGDTEITTGVTGLEIADGFFAVNILTSNGVGTYFLTDSTEDFSVAEASVNYATFTIMYAVELTEPTTLEWGWGDIPDTIIVQGMFPNEDNTYAAGEITLAYADETPIATADFANGSVFGFLFDGGDFTKTGDIGLYIDGILALEGAVMPGEMEVTFSPEEAMRYLGDVEFTAEFNLDDMYLDDNQQYLDSDYELWAIIDDGSVDGYPINLTGRFEDQKAVRSMNLDSETLGDYEIAFELRNVASDTFVALEGTASIEIIETEDYNLMSWDDSALSVGDNWFGFVMDPMSGGRGIVVFNEDGNEYVHLEATFDGAGIEDVTFDTNGSTDFKITPTQTGLVEVTINVYEGTMTPGTAVDFDFDNNDPIHTFTRELEVDGWNVTVTPDTVDVGSEVDITITITDENGNEINNAIITSSECKVGYSNYPILFDAGTTNVVGGVYVIEYNDDMLDFDSVRAIDLSFWSEESYDAMTSSVITTPTADIYLAKGIDVVGLDVYSVTSDTDTMLEGFDETVAITPLDSDGDVIYPNMYITYYDEDGDEVAEMSALLGGTRRDLNDDGIKEAIEYELTPLAGAVKAVVRAQSADLKAFGEVEIEVVKPLIVMTKAVNATAFVKTDFEFTVIDPRDGSLMDDTVTVVEDDANLITLSNEGVSEDNGVYAVTVFAEDVDYVTADDDEVDVTFEFRMDADTVGGILLTEVLVLEPTLTANPAEIVIGTSANIVLTYLDADGMPLEDYDVDLFGDKIGTTDENGQVRYATTATNTTGLEFYADTDSNETIMCKVTTGVDLEAPKATLVESNGVATITITDNVRVTKAMVNGVIVDMFYAAPTVVHMMPVTEQYHVQAIDANFNYLMVTLQSGATTPMLEIMIGRDTGYGPAVLLAGTTMVPVRYAEELGAMVTWNNASKTATYSLNGTVITVQVGNKTARVNGEAVIMPQAPYINDKSRTMVPLRMIAEELGFTVNWLGNGQITIQ